MAALSARDSNAATYRLDNGLNACSTTWVLDANMLLCAGCSARQYARDAAQPFRHGDGCALASELTLYPWRELAKLLRAVPQVPA